MGTEYLIDSNRVIGYLDNKIPTSGMDMLHVIINKIPNLWVITKIEVLRFNGSDQSYNILVDFINASRVFDLDSLVIDATITICKAHRIKIPDAIIAATAVTHNMTLITRNISDFKNIFGLTIFNPWA